MLDWLSSNWSGILSILNAVAALFLHVTKSDKSA